MKRKVVIYFLCSIMSTAMLAGCKDKENDSSLSYTENFVDNNENTETTVTESVATVVEEKETLAEETVTSDSESIQEEMDRIEAKSVEFETADWGSMSQMEMNTTTADWYALWDDELNLLWERLSNEADEEKKEVILEEQREWIVKKDEAIKTAGSLVEGGSMQPQLENTTAKDLTRARAYVLASYLAEVRGEEFSISEDVQASLSETESSVDAVFEYFEGVWPIFDEEDGLCGIQKLEDSEFMADDFAEGTKWVFWYTRGGVFTESNVVDFTKDTITFEAGGIYYKMIENMAGEIELYYGETTSLDDMEMVFMADKSYN